MKIRTVSGIFLLLSFFFCTELRAQDPGSWATKQNEIDEKKDPVRKLAKSIFKQDSIYNSGFPRIYALPQGKDTISNLTHHFKVFIPENTSKMPVIIPPPDFKSKMPVHRPPKKQ